MGNGREPLGKTSENQERICLIKMAPIAVCGDVMLYWLSPGMCVKSPRKLNQLFRSKATR